jgi:hypothetical protein
MIGSTICGICVICIGALGTVKNQSESVGSALIALSCVWVYAYALSLAPIGMFRHRDWSSEVIKLSSFWSDIRIVGWIFVGEVSTSALRSKTAAFATLISSLLHIVFVSRIAVV